MVPLSFAGHEFIMLPEAALYWPARRALLLADLHFEKASWYARHGQMLPPYDSLATLHVIDSLVRQWEPREIWCLGDSFHDEAGTGRLPQEACDILGRLAQAARWTWITGNHDAAPALDIGAAICTEAEVEGILLRHEADPAERRPELSGHFHPKFRMTMYGRRISRRCFIYSNRKIILPAFGALTGGLDARRPEIKAAMGETGDALIPLRNRLLRFRLAGDL